MYIDQFQLSESTKICCFLVSFSTPRSPVALLTPWLSIHLFSYTTSDKEIVKERLRLGRTHTKLINLNKKVTKKPKINGNAHTQWIAMFAKNYICLFDDYDIEFAHYERKSHDSLLPIQTRSYTHITVFPSLKKKIFSLLFRKLSSSRTTPLGSPQSTR